MSGGIFFYLHKFAWNSSSFSRRPLSNKAIWLHCDYSLACGCSHMQPRPLSLFLCLFPVCLVLHIPEVIYFWQNKSLSINTYIWDLSVWGHIENISFYNKKQNENKRTFLNKWSKNVAHSLVVFNTSNTLYFWWLIYVCIITCVLIQ